MCTRPPHPWPRAPHPKEQNGRVPSGPLQELTRIQKRAAVIPNQRKHTHKRAHLITMMTQLLLRLTRSNTPACPDDRSVAAVFDAAAERFGRAREPAVVEALVTSGVEQAQQLLQLSEGHWERLGVSLGLETAVKAELADPSQLPLLMKQDLTDKRIRQFLLLPGEDGKEAKPIGAFSAFGLSLLATPPRERQNLLLALCEMTALVCGLFLQLPLEFLRHPSFAATEKGWDVTPTVADGMDALAIVLFLCDAYLAVVAVFMALMVAAGGWEADDSFCQSALGVIAGIMMGGFLHMYLWPLLALAFWHGFTDATSPYPLLGSFVLIQVIINLFNTLMFTFMIDQFPLEMYHIPRWIKVDLRNSMPWLRHKLKDDVIRIEAERRAAKLAAQMGIAR